MLYPIYHDIESRINHPELDNELLEGINLPIEWYNVQYEETMVNENGIFIEFPDRIPIDDLSKDAQRAPIRIRIHVYSKALRTNDGITGAQVQAHEALATGALNLLKNWAPSGCKPLKWVGWQHWHRWKGWMVTFIEFDSKMMV